MKRRTPMEMYADKRNAQMKGAAADKIRLEKPQTISPMSAMKPNPPDMTKTLKNTGAAPKIKKRVTIGQAMGKYGKIGRLKALGNK